MATDKVVIDITAKDKTSKGVKSAEKSFKSFAKTIGPLITVGFGVAAIKKATDAYIRQENAIAQLDARLKSTSNAVGIASSELQNMASSLQSVTTFGDEAIIEMQSLLLTFTKIGGQTFPQATEAILNVSTAMGQDLKTSAIQVGKALNDPIAGISAMSRSGIQFTDVQKDMIKSLTESGDLIGAQTIILKELETQFGGAARAAKNTLGGALTSLSNTFGDEVFEALGKGGTGFVPLLQQMEGILTSSQFRSGMDSLSEGISDVGWALGLIGENVGKAQPLFDFLTSDAFLSQIPGANLLNIASSLREISAVGDGRQPVPPKPAGGFISPDEQAAINAGGGQPATPAEAERLIDPLDTLEAQLQAQQAIDAVLQEQQLMHNEAMAQMYADDLAAKENTNRLKADSERALVGDVIGLIGVLAGESKTWALAGLLITKGIALADIFVSTQAAAVAALAPPPLGLGPVAGIPLAASIEGIGYARMGVVAATTLLQGAQTASSKKPSAGGGSSGLSSPVSQPTGTQLTERDTADIRVEGNSVLAVIVEEQIIPALNEARSRGVDLVLT